MNGLLAISRMVVYTYPLGLIGLCMLLFSALSFVGILFQGMVLKGICGE